MEITQASQPYKAEIDTNKATGQLLLKKFEEQAKSTMEGLLKKVRDNVDDEDVKKKYYQARAIYNEVAEQTGAESPAKKEEQKAMKEAIVNKKKADIVTKVKDVTTVTDFIEKIEVIEVEPRIIECFQEL
jgi:hypothetical protein